MKGRFHNSNITTDLDLIVLNFGSEIVALKQADDFFKLVIERGPAQALFEWGGEVGPNSSISRPKVLHYGRGVNSLIL
jgi:hypothetical protein